MSNEPLSAEDRTALERVWKFAGERGLYATANEVRRFMDQYCFHCGALLDEDGNCTINAPLPPTQPSERIPLPDPRLREAQPK